MPHYSDQNLHKASWTVISKVILVTFWYLNYVGSLSIFSNIPNINFETISDKKLFLARPLQTSNLKIPAFAWCLETLLCCTWKLCCLSTFYHFYICRQFYFKCYINTFFTIIYSLSPAVVLNFKGGGRSFVWCGLVWLGFLLFWVFFSIIFLFSEVVSYGLLLSVTCIFNLVLIKSNNFFHSILIGHFLFGLWSELLIAASAHVRI